MYEVEVKVRADHDAVRERLSELDAQSLGTVVQVDTYFDAPHREFAETDEALRVRQVAAVDDARASAPDPDAKLSDDADFRLTYKGPLVESAAKTREEVEVGVADGPEMRAILDRLGFQPVATVRKARERYALDGYVVALDAVTDLGEFVEVESGATEADIEAVHDGVFEVFSRLGLDPDDSIRTSYLELLLTAG
jgi:adenylate cyclase class 2